MIRRQAVLFTAQPQEVQQITKLTHEADHTLFHTKTVFPFDLFPDDITIDFLSITVTQHIFFTSGSIKTLYFADIGVVTVERGPVFATLNILDRMTQRILMQVKPLFTPQAIKAQHLIQGIITANKQKIDITKLPHNTAAAQLEKLGEALN